jgi:hypothetical protein
MVTIGNQTRPSARADVPLIDAVGEHLFGALQDLRRELHGAVSGALTLGSGLTQAAFTSARLVVDRIDAVAAAGVSEGERAVLRLLRGLQDGSNQMRSGLVGVVQAAAGTSSDQADSARPMA